MSDLVDHANYQAQRELDVLLRHSYTAPANSIYDCIECDKPIGIQRKAAIPFATRCMACQSMFERKR